MNRNTNEIPIMECGARELHAVEFIAALDCQIAGGGKASGSKAESRAGSMAAIPDCKEGR